MKDRMKAAIGQRAIKAHARHFRLHIGGMYVKLNTYGKIKCWH